MPEALNTDLKARAINLEGFHYGTFAEIGAAQEVARHFFQAGHASATIAKTMSAYDKSFSDSIYGHTGRFVSQERLVKMLKYEYSLLEKRLPQYANEKSFFAFANTVSISSEEGHSQCWSGLLFQTRPKTKPCFIILYLRLLDHSRLEQHEALGIIGVNLIHTAFQKNLNVENFISRLKENLREGRIDINHIEIKGKELAHLDSRHLGLELVKQKLSTVILFAPDGSIKAPSDVLYNKTLLVQRGAFRPINKTSLQILEKAQKHIKKVAQVPQSNLVTLLEISMNQFFSENKKMHRNDFIDRIDTLGTLGYFTLISNYPSYTYLKQYLRTRTQSYIAIVMGGQNLEKIFKLNKKTSQSAADVLCFLAVFFNDEKTCLLIYPYKTDKICLTSRSFNPHPKLKNIYKHFIETKHILDIAQCEKVDISVKSETIEKMIKKHNSQWVKLVPPQIVPLIKRKKMFGYKKK